MPLGTIARRALSALPALVLLSCCGAMGVAPAAPPLAFAVRGSVSFGARLPTSTGASAESMRPADHTEIAVLDAAGATLVTGTTDEAGAFALEGSGAAALVEVRARTAIGAQRLGVSRDAAGRVVHAYRAPIAADGTAVVAISDAASSMAGALHILTTLRRGLVAVAAWTGRALPELYVYWERGVTTEWSFFRGERGPGRFCLELLGGAPGAQATSDTDEHDEAIILHELGHFVFDRTTTSASIGGMHARGALLDPGVAWEEGRATWFATAVLGDPAYVDSVGLAPVGSARVDENLEAPQPPRGLGSETSVAAILWDLADGAAPGAAPDRDGDGVALGPGAVLTAMLEMYVAGESYGSIADLLAHLERSGAVSHAELAAMLAATGEPASILGATWPTELAPGARVVGKIDGLSNPAPSGGEARPANGFDAVAAYRVRVPARGMLSARLVIDGSGAAADGTDLELELRDLHADLLVGSYGTSAVESVARVVEPGSVVVYVRDAGSGNRADYTLEIELTPMP